MVRPIRAIASKDGGAGHANSDSNAEEFTGSWTARALSGCQKETADASQVLQGEYSRVITSKSEKLPGRTVFWPPGIRP
jgi:hypothetical protein